MATVRTHKKPVPSKAAVIIENIALKERIAELEKQVAALSATTAPAPRSTTRRIPSTPRAAEQAALALALREAALRGVRGISLQGNTLKVKGNNDIVGAEAIIKALASM